MSAIDYAIFAAYMVGILWVGYYHFKRNKDAEDYYVGGRNVSAGHVGLSVVATDVGGGFSIGLGGLGFALGLSASWLLFTGLIGAWLSAVFIIPIVKKEDSRLGYLTYPDFLRTRFGDKVALVVAVVSALGYLGFTGGQVLAGAKLSAGTLFREAPGGFASVNFSILVIGFIIVAYTVLGGLKAVIYTDTVQWIVLLFGLIFLAIPFSVYEIGGVEALMDALPARFYRLDNVSWSQVVEWTVTVIPIWVVAMTLYQRIYACKDTKSARRAWFIAGAFEYPVMAFMGAFLGMCARILFEDIDPEMGIPILIGEVLPVGLAGIVVAAYFSAIMSTADSCLIASSGNIVGDVVRRHIAPNLTDKGEMRLSQVMTLVLGVIAMLLAWVAAQRGGVLDAILYAYSFMVSALFVPTLGAYFWKKSSPAGAMAGILVGGTTTLVLSLFSVTLPWGLPATAFGIAASAAAFVSLTYLVPKGTTSSRRGQCSL